MDASHAKEEVWEGSRSYPPTTIDKHQQQKHGLTPRQIHDVGDGVVEGDLVLVLVRM
jgi:hypothetical protein